jgi:chorismate mutase / prephenate dehydratase
MKDIRELRDELDIIDKEIVELFEKRMAVSEEVADYKIANAKPVLDIEREQSKIAKVGEMASSDFNRIGIEELFQQLMSMSRKLQYRKLTEKGVLGNLPFIRLDQLQLKNVRVVYQGVEGAYSEKAVKSFFGSDANSFHVESFRDAMNMIADGAADYAVLPIENSSAGIVTQNYDMLMEFENYIVAEQIVRIEHCLLGLPEAEIEDIDSVYSHVQGLMQCGGFLEKHRKMTAYQAKNTAIAAKSVKEAGLLSQAAIASEEAAELYGLKILARDIADNKENYTRFIIVSNQRVFQKDANKISICFQLPHRKGSLYRLMSHFIYNGLNMTKIESRPIPERTWEYRFFVDFDGNLNDSAVKNAIRGIREEANNLRILGNY